MKETNLPDQEVVGNQIVEDISHIICEALGEGAVACQACDSTLWEGTRVVVYAFRPVGEPTFQIGYTKCAEGRYAPSECFTLGVRELLVEGRVGKCSDQAMQLSWPVLVAPEPVAVSAASTTSVRWFSDDAWERVRNDVVGEPGPVTELDEDEPVSLVDRVLRVRVAEQCAALRECEASCGGGVR